jgi:hypothetical protein
MGVASQKRVWFVEMMEQVLHKTGGSDNEQGQRST